jgi:hypothetical protein
MSDTASRAAAAALVLAGLATLALFAAGPQAAALGDRHVQLMTLGTGLLLVAAGPWPGMRWAAVVAGLLAKGGFLAAWTTSLPQPGAATWVVAVEAALLALVLAAAAVLGWQAHRDARWEGGRGAWTGG